MSEKEFRPRTISLEKPTDSRGRSPELIAIINELESSDTLRGKALGRFLDTVIPLDISKEKQLVFKDLCSEIFSISSETSPKEKQAYREKLRAFITKDPLWGSLGYEATRLEEAVFNLLAAENFVARYRSWKSTKKKGEIFTPQSDEEIHALYFDEYEYFFVKNAREGDKMHPVTRIEFDLFDIREQENLDHKTYLATKYGCTKEEVSVSEQEFHSGTCKVHYGDITVHAMGDFKDQPYPIHVHGDLILVQPNELVNNNFFAQSTIHGTVTIKNTLETFHNIGEEDPHPVSIPEKEHIVLTLRGGSVKIEHSLDIKGSLTIQGTVQGFIHGATIPQIADYPDFFRFRFDKHGKIILREGVRVGNFHSAGIDAFRTCITLPQKTLRELHAPLCDDIPPIPLTTEVLALGIENTALLHSLPRFVFLKKLLLPRVTAISEGTSLPKTLQELNCPILTDGTHLTLPPLLERLSAPLLIQTPLLPNSLTDLKMGITSIGGIDFPESLQVGNFPHCVFVDNAHIPPGAKITVHHSVQHFFDKNRALFTRAWFDSHPEMTHEEMPLPQEKQEIQKEDPYITQPFAIKRASGNNPSPSPLLTPSSSEPVIPSPITLPPAIEQPPEPSSESIFTKIASIFRGFFRG